MVVKYSTSQTKVFAHQSTAEENQSEEPNEATICETGCTVGAREHVARDFVSRVVRRSTAVNVPIVVA